MTTPPSSPSPRQPAKPPARRRKKRETWDQKLMRWFPVVVRYAGVVIGLYEAFLEDVDRPGILALAGSMMAGSFVVEAIRRD